jgi:hypothetical protein
MKDELPIRNFVRPAPVPSVRIGDRCVPRVVLGDHNFLAKFGSVMTDTEVTERMLEALKRAEVGLAAGEARCGYAAMEACRIAGRDTSATIVHHDDIAVRLRGQPLRYRRCAATLRTLLYGHGFLVDQDPVLAFLGDWSPGECLSRFELQSLDVASEFSADSVGRTAMSGPPALVTIGGDWLDLLLMAGLHSLATEAFSIVAGRARLVGAAVALTSYVGGLCPTSATEPLLEQSDAILLPFNESGHGMVPNASTALAWAASSGLPLLGMHLLAGGNTDIRRALKACAEAGVSVAVVGASQVANIQLLTDAVTDV